jgi:predicted DNA-binding transcriptional regulator AlpA
VRAISNLNRHISVSRDARYLTVGQLRERFGVSCMWIVRRMADAGFPKPVRLGGRLRFWRVEEIEARENDRPRAAS